MSILAGVFADIMTQTQNLEIQGIARLENIALYVTWN